MLPKLIKLDKNVLTSEDWCPTLSGGRIRCTLYLNIRQRDGKKVKLWHRVCLWGGDDLGYEKDFTGPPDEAKALYDEICGLPEVNFIDLKKRGFKLA